MPIIRLVTRIGVMDSVEGRKRTRLDKHGKVYYHLENVSTLYLLMYYGGRTWIVEEATEDRTSEGKLPSCGEP